MKRTKVDPWAFPGFFGTGVMVEGHRRILVFNGQAAVSDSRESMHPGDIRAQAD